GLTRRYDPKGHALSETESRSWARAAVPGRPGSWVWLERPTKEDPLDALILERSALAVQTLTGASGRGTDDAVVRIACDADVLEADRLDAVRALGLTGPVTVIVTSGPGLSEPHSTRIGGHGVALAPGATALPPDLRAGTAVAHEPLDLPAALDRARIALRLTDRVSGPGPSLVAYDELGALAVLAERITPLEAAAANDVRHLDQVFGTHPWVIDTLQTVLDQPSLRQAATGLHVHHSTLQERLSWLSAQLGYAVTKPGGRQRAAVAVLLWRIAHSQGEHTGGNP
ncbi:helix-turn-helix domain-containing protein, partial [Streptomyces sp. bgisy027]